MTESATPRSSTSIGEFSHRDDGTTAVGLFAPCGVQRRERRQVAIRSSFDVAFLVLPARMLPLIASAVAHGGETSCRADAADKALRVAVAQRTAFGTLAWLRPTQCRFVGLSILEFAPRPRAAPAKQSSDDRRCIGIVKRTRMRHVPHVTAGHDRALPPGSLQAWSPHGNEPESRPHGVVRWTGLWYAVRMRTSHPSCGSPTPPCGSVGAAVGSVLSQGKIA